MIKRILAFLVCALISASALTQSTVTTTVAANPTAAITTLTGTSADLAGALSDETGTGVAVFGTLPTFTTGINIGASPAASGSIRLQDTERISWKTTGSNYIGLRCDAAAGCDFSGGTVFAPALNLRTASGLIFDMPVGTTAALTGALTVSSTTAANGGLIRGITTQTGATYTVSTADTHIIANRAGTITLTLGTATTGRELTVRTIQAQTVVSASSNVVPCVGGAAGTAILAGTAGKWAMLVGDGTNWQIQTCN